MMCRDKERKKDMARKKIRHGEKERKRVREMSKVWNELLKILIESCSLGITLTILVR